MAAITSENLALAIVKYLAAEAMDVLEPVFVMGTLVNRSYEPVLAQAGDTVNVPIPPVLVANNLAETGSVQTQNPTPGNAQIVLDTHAESSFVIPDVTKAIASVDLMRMYLQPALVALATRMEQDLLGHYARFVANTPLGTGGSPLTESTVDAAEKALFDAYVPVSVAKNLIVGSQSYTDLRKISRFSENLTNGDGSAITTGVLGKVKNFNVFRSQLVPFVGGTYYNLAFATNALGLVTRRLDPPMAGTGAIAEYAEKGNFGLRIIISYNPNTLSQQFTADVLYGSAPLRNQFAVILRA